jgi:hypothetical protein
VAAFIHSHNPSLPVEQYIFTEEGRNTFEEYY